MTTTAQRRRATALLIATAALTALGTAGAHADSPGGWVSTGSTTVNSVTGGEGIATRADGSLLTRGLGSIPLSLRVAGWNHIGDPDIADGDIFDAYQGGDDAASKMFAVTTPAGTRTTTRTRWTRASCSTTPSTPSPPTPSGWWPASGAR